MLIFRFDFDTVTRKKWNKITRVLATQLCNTLCTYVTTTAKLRGAPTANFDWEQEKKQTKSLQDLCSVCYGNVTEKQFFGCKHSLRFQLLDDSVCRCLLCVGALSCVAAVLAVQIAGKHKPINVNLHRSLLNMFNEK